MISQQQQTRVPRQAGVDTAPHPQRDGQQYVRWLAREGRLAETYQSAGPELRRLISGAVIEIATPVVFIRVTRVVELKRGHTACAVGVDRLADACLDRFYDDLEAVTYDVLHNATRSIANLEGWLTGRLRAATVDAHRRRRGARGALQRPRLPAWLAEGLGNDRWLCHLAVEILTWVGVPTTAGTSLWPVDSWAERRIAFLGARTGDDTRVVEREVERVLAVMRRRPGWYQDYVERPLGAKTPPLATTPVDATGEEPAPLPLVGPDEVLDARLAELAGLALQAIHHKIAEGIDLVAAVADVLKHVFGPVTVAHDIGGLPHAASTADERVAELVSNPAELARIVDVVSEILGCRRPGTS